MAVLQQNNHRRKVSFFIKDILEDDENEDRTRQEKQLGDSLGGNVTVHKEPIQELRQVGSKTESKLMAQKKEKKESDNNAENTQTLYHDKARNDAPLTSDRTNQRLVEHPRLSSNVEGVCQHVGLTNGIYVHGQGFPFKYVVGHGKSSHSQLHSQSGSHSVCIGSYPDRGPYTGIHNLSLGKSQSHQSRHPCFPLRGPYTGIHNLSVSVNLNLIS